MAGGNVILNTHGLVISKENTLLMRNPLVRGSTVTNMCDSPGIPSTNVAFVAVESDVQGRPGKVPFEKGYSQMDWLLRAKKMNRIQPRRDGITMAEVMKHNTVEDGWTVIDGKVYNISPYLQYHPGGAKILKSALGRDCTKLFRKYHAWVNYDMLLDKCFIGPFIE